MLFLYVQFHEVQVEICVEVPAGVSDQIFIFYCLPV